MPNPESMDDQRPGVAGSEYPRQRWNRVGQSVQFCFSGRWDIDQLIAIVQAYPRVTAPRLALIECGQALDRLADGETLIDPPEPPADPQGWMLQRVQLYAASPAGQRGIYTPDARRWFAEDMFAVDPKMWEVADDGTRQRVESTRSTTQRVIQERQEKRRQEATRLAAEKAEHHRILDAMTDEQVEQCRQHVLGWVAPFQRASLAQQNPRGHTLLAGLIVAEFKKMGGAA